MNKSVFKRIGKEQNVSGSFANIALAIAMAVVVSVIFILALGENPITVFAYIFRGAFRNRSSVLEILAKATPIIAIGLGISVAAATGMTNLGGDGQFYVGAISAALVGIYLDAPVIVVWLVALIVAILAGGLWGGFAGFLKATLDTSEVIVAIMMNYIALFLIGYLVSNPFQAPGGIPQTRAIPQNMQLPKLLQGSRAHWGIVFVALLAVVVQFVMSKTVFGFQLQTIGRSRKAAYYGGISVKKLSIVSMFIAGSFAGLAGMIEVYGTYYRVLEGISSDFGFTAVMIAILAKYRPAGIIVGSLLISALTVGVNSMQISVNVPTSIVTVIQSVVVFSILVMPTIRSNLVSRRHLRKMSTSLSDTKEA